MMMRRKLAVAIAVLIASTVARSGHEQPVYPSYYPHEIEIAAVPPELAPELLGTGKLHAYVGRAPAPTAAPPGAIGEVESLGSFIVVRVNPDSVIARDEAAACAAAGELARLIGMGAGAADLTFHPYPVTPFHGDYLYHDDRAEAARQRLLSADAATLPGQLKVQAAGTLARRLVRPDWVVDSGEWDVAIEEVSAAQLLADTTVALNGWLGPRWIRSGWFHAYGLLASSIVDTTQRGRIDGLLERLQGADYEGLAQRFNLERDIVQSLQAGCRAMVVGYTVKREYFSSEYSAGIENILSDALEGFSSPMFLRTVKLKDYPWNGLLHLGIEGRPDAAWNPIAGFTDPFGRLAWYAIGDPAVVPSPNESTWILNRISEVEASPRK
jgi:hypothetical protein